MDGLTNDRHMAVGVVSYQICQGVHRGVEACDRTCPVGHHDVVVYHQNGQVARHGVVVCHQSDLAVHRDVGAVYHKICQEVHRDMVVAHDDTVCHLAIALFVCHHNFSYHHAEEEVYYNNRHNRNYIAHSNLMCNRQEVAGVEGGGDVGEEDNHKEGVDGDGDAEVVAVVDGDSLVVVVAVPCLRPNSAHCHIGNTGCQKLVAFSHLHPSVCILRNWNFVIPILILSQVLMETYTYFGYWSHR